MCRRIEFENQDNVLQIGVVILKLILRMARAGFCKWEYYRKQEWQID